MGLKSAFSWTFTLDDITTSCLERSKYFLPDFLSSGEVSRRDSTLLEGLDGRPTSSLIAD